MEQSGGLTLSFVVARENRKEMKLGHEVSTIDNHVITMLLDPHEQRTTYEERYSAPKRSKAFVIHHQK
jgi:hypothetical protein